MSYQRINGVSLYYETAGSGDPLVLVHGSWGDHDNWAQIVPALSQSFLVVTFDRRGHSQSEAGPGQGSVREDAADLGALIEALGLGAAHVVGNSFGASISLRLAGQRPELFRSLVVHEPPLLDLLRTRPEVRPMLDGFDGRIRPVIELLEASEWQAAAQRFVDTVAFGPGAWDALPQPVRETFVRNGPTYLDETRDPEGLTLDLKTLSAFDKPVLVSAGTESPAFFRPIAETVAEVLPRGSMRVLRGAGHVPHLSHPDEYVESLRAFYAASQAPAFRPASPLRAG